MPCAQASREARGPEIDRLEDDPAALPPHDHFALTLRKTAILWKPNRLAPSILEKLCAGNRHPIEYRHVSLLGQAHHGARRDRLRTPLQIGRRCRRIETARRRERGCEQSRAFPIERCRRAALTLVNAVGTPAASA
jgi:hypothetical protein